jgi:oligosaccharide reducing-end xylanase
MRIADPKHPSYRGYAWVVNTKGQICDENSAPDGEEYFAMTLYFAHNRWGSAKSTASNNYKYWADELLDVMKNRPSLAGSRVRQIVASSGAACAGAKITDKVTSVPLFDTTQKQPLFNPTLNEKYTDPSYHLPAFYNLFALWGPAKDAEFWNSAAATSRSFLGRAMNANTGLVSEITSFDGSPHSVSYNSLSKQFAYDSWRVGGNVGMDWAWLMQPGSELQARADALVSFFASKGPTTYLAVWNVDGTNESGFHSPGLIAMNAVATLATTDAVKEQAKALVEDLWNTELPNGKYRYYDGLLYTVAMLHLSGEYKIYMPQTKQ